MQVSKNNLPLKGCILSDTLVKKMCFVVSFKIVKVLSERKTQNKLVFVYCAVVGSFVLLLQTIPWCMPAFWRSVACECEVTLALSEMGCSVGV